MYALAFNPRRPLLAYSNGGGTIEVFDQAMGAFVSPGPEPLSGGVRQLAFSPDGRALAAVGSGTDNSVALWDVERGEPAGGCAPQTMPVSGASPSARTGAPWPPAGARRRRTKRVHPGRHPPLGPGPQGAPRSGPGGAHGLGHRPGLQRRLAPAGVRQRRQDRSPLGRRRPGAGQERGARSPTTGGGGHPQPGLQPGGRTLASGDRNGTIILWDASGRQPREVARLTDHGGAILSLAFSPTGGRWCPAATTGRSASGTWLPAGPSAPAWPGTWPKCRAWPSARTGRSWPRRGRTGGSSSGTWTCTPGAKACEVAGRALRPDERESHLAGVAACPWRPAFEETCAQDALRRADAAALADEPERARAAFREAVVVAARTEDAWINNEVCWYGSIGGAGAVLPACERAVQLAVGETEWQVRDSRGIALAVTGQLARAQEDFEQYAKWAATRTTWLLCWRRRRRWIEQLKARQNPFADPAELRALRTESSLLLDQ